MANEHFIDGEGYLSFGKEKYSEFREIVSKTGWHLRLTPDGKPGASFSPKFLGANASDVRDYHPNIAEAAKDQGIKAFR